MKPLTQGDLATGRRVMVHYTQETLDIEYIIVAGPHLRQESGAPEASRSLRITVLRPEYSGSYSHDAILAGRVEPRHTQDLFLDEIGVLSYRNGDWSLNTCFAAEAAIRADALAT